MGDAIILSILKSLSVPQYYSGATCHYLYSNLSDRTLKNCSKKVNPAKAGGTKQWVYKPQLLGYDCQAAGKNINDPMAWNSQAIFFSGWPA
jgi:hypothetical protein